MQWINKQIQQIKKLMQQKQINKEEKAENATKKHGQQTNKQGHSMKLVQLNVIPQRNFTCQRVPKYVPCYITIIWFVWLSFPATATPIPTKASLPGYLFPPKYLHSSA